MKTSSGGGLHNGPFDHLANGGKMTRSQFESITHNTNNEDPLLFNEMPSVGDGNAAFKGAQAARHQILHGGNSGN